MTINRILDLVANTSDEVKAENAAINQKRNIKRFSTQSPREGNICIVGGGPSLADCLDELKWRQAAGQQVWATNNTYSYLLEQGIQPDVHVFLDARPECVDFIHPNKSVVYYLNQSCHPSLFDKLTGCTVIMYDLNGVGTGSTVGLKALYLAGFSGYRNFHLFGMDSSYRETSHHAYTQPLNDGEQVHDVEVDGVKFRAAVWMIFQAEEFQQIAASFAEQDCVITVSGDGLLPHVAHRISRNYRVVTAVYDLMVCPPTYDFISFLCEAERYRLEIGAEAIDIVIQPGPVDGFREDVLPDSNASRVGMLYRVVMGACRLLPSVRNVEVLKMRKRVEGADIFPVGYLKDPSIQNYGVSFFPSAMPVISSTKSARKAIKFDKPYVTITLRESSHWPQRNSQRKEWERAARRIENLGYAVVWVPDVESADANQYSWDIDLRLALYEKAAINLGINNGPMCMLFYANAQYLIFKMVTEELPWTAADFLERAGIPEGNTRNGRIIWKEDKEDVIVDEFMDYMELRELEVA